MTPDEMSELAEALDDACAEAVAKGCVIRPHTGPPRPGECCPFGALLGRQYPDAYYAAEVARVPVGFVLGFMQAFDCARLRPGVPAFDMGHRFWRVWCEERANDENAAPEGGA